MHTTKIMSMFVITVLLTTHHTPLKSGAVTWLVAGAVLTAGGMYAYQQYKEKHKYDWTQSNDPKEIVNGTIDAGKEGLDTLNGAGKKGLDKLKEILGK